MALTETRVVVLSSAIQRTGIDKYRWNRRIGWMSACTGVGIGLWMGLWAFQGPVTTPPWIGNYDDVSRRLIRLGHIAFLGLGILNILMARELSSLAIRPGAIRIAAVAMNFGNALLPVTLFAAGAYHPLKYLMPLPASAVFVALLVTAVGVWRTEST